MANPQRKLTPASEDLVRLRDEIAMHALNGMIVRGGWGWTDSEGGHHPYKDMREYSQAACEFADFMLDAREKH